jgi:putative FmdB family regulatory protein
VNSLGALFCASGFAFDDGHPDCPSHDVPTYDYACLRCGPFDAMRPIALREAPVPCPTCADPAPRVLGGMPRLGGGLNSGGRESEGSYARMRHPSACACCPP